jgi:hypothetical protein
MKQRRQKAARERHAKNSGAGKRGAGKRGTGKKGAVEFKRDRLVPFLNMEHPAAKALLQEGVWVSPEPIVSDEELTKLRNEFEARTRDWPNITKSLGVHAICKNDAASQVARPIRDIIAERFFHPLYKGVPLQAGQDTFSSDFIAPEEKGGNHFSFNKIFTLADGTPWVPKTPAEFELYYKTSWAHFDQRLAKKGFQCVQAAINLSDEVMTKEDVCFVAMPKSHLFREQLAKEFPELEKVNKDWVKLTPAQLVRLEQLTGHKLTAFTVPPGHVFAWRSDVLHCNELADKLYFVQPIPDPKDPTKVVFKRTAALRKKDRYVRKKPKVRKVVYCSCLPAELCDKKAAWNNFVKGLATSHWADVVKPNKAFPGRYHIALRLHKEDSKLPSLELPLPDPVTILPEKAARRYGWMGQQTNRVRKISGDRVLVIHDHPINTTYNCTTDAKWQLSMKEREIQVRQHLGPDFPIPPISDFPALPAKIPAAPIGSSSSSFSSSSSSSRMVPPSPMIGAPVTQAAPKFQIYDISNRVMVYPVSSQVAPQALASMKSTQDPMLPGSPVTRVRKRYDDMPHLEAPGATVNLGTGKVNLETGKVYKRARP